MKKVSTMLAAIFCLLLAAGAALAQQPQNAAVNFAGSWELDVAKSKLPERARVESMTLNVAQSDRELKVETAAKRAVRPEGTMPNDGSGGMPADGNRGIRNGGAGTGGGMGRGGMMGGGNGTLTYSLDGRETTVETETPGGMPPASIKLLAKTEKDGKLKLVSTRSFDSPMGSVSIKTTEIWELSGDGKNLKITRDTETPRGAQTAEMYFTRKVLAAAGDEFKGAAIVGDKPMMAPVELSAKDMTGIGGGVIKNPNDKSLSGASPMPKSISKGVLNGSALNLVKPAYPAEAREVRAGGAVNVQVTIDEQGRVVSAKAVSGHQALRAAAEDAARASTFSPTMLEGIPVKVTGVIVYNFVP